MSGSKGLQLTGYSSFHGGPDTPGVGVSQLAHNPDYSEWNQSCQTQKSSRPPRARQSMMGGGYSGTCRSITTGGWAGGQSAAGHQRLISWANGVWAGHGRQGSTDGNSPGGSPRRSPPRVNTVGATSVCSRYTRKASGSRIHGSHIVRARHSRQARMPQSIQYAPEADMAAQPTGRMGCITCWPLTPDVFFAVRKHLSRAFIPATHVPSCLVPWSGHRAHHKLLFTRAL